MKKDKKMPSEKMMSDKEMAKKMKENMKPSKAKKAKKSY